MMLRYAQSGYQLAAYHKLRGLTCLENRVLVLPARFCWCLSVWKSICYKRLMKTTILKYPVCYLQPHEMQCGMRIINLPWAQPNKTHRQGYTADRKGRLRCSKSRREGMHKSQPSNEPQAPIRLLKGVREPVFSRHSSG